ncbi:MAG: ribosome-associated translation inhibitor RaiA [Candidatus Sungiibacteriota bacterium]|uniref:Ribosome-associated translation inhibitor RaiA n=1 Tax=Candidatus Sungiibacteriota bacterium TaxID=2750080 RepID=A0A7T5US32_9BACT|nr:MAG: ribosome-associated translation inhibitor RaiA [Candidatus Sungbacteria bacterium]
MRVAVRQKNLTITPALRVYIETKILKPLGRLLQKVAPTELPILDLEFGRRSRHHRKGAVYHAEANLSLGSRMIRAVVDDEDIRVAVDLLEEELERGILGWKGKARAKYLRGARRAKKDLSLDQAARLYRKGRIRNEGN